MGLILLLMLMAQFFYTGRAYQFFRAEGNYLPSQRSDKAANVFKVP